MEEAKFWWEKAVKETPDKIIVKLKQNDKFLKSIILPTVMYPVGEGFRAFHCKNTSSDLPEEILEIFDKAGYQIGRCYQNTDSLIRLLKASGIDAKSYVGWLFVDGGLEPVHHCWCVVGDSVLDLADDYSLMYSAENRKYFEGKSLEESRELMIDFAKEAKSIKNSQRCFPVGVSTPFLYYVGSECPPDTGRMIYKNLIKQYPNHPCHKGCNQNGLNLTQQKMKEAGL